MLDLLHTLVTGCLPQLLVLALFLAVAKGVWDWLTQLGQPKKPGKKGPEKDLFGNPMPPKEG